MIRGFLLLSIGASLFASSDYVPFSKFSKDKQIEYNFVKVEKNTNEKVQTAKEIKKTEIKKPISQNITNIENREIITEYQKENILNENIKDKDNFFDKDFSITPRLSYMYLSSSIDGENIDKTNEVIPEISVQYMKHTLKVDYLEANIRKDLATSDFKLDTKWLRIAYLYKLYNSNIGLGFNNIKYKNNYLLDTKDKQSFPTLEVHLKNTKDKLVLDYGGFYGRNGDDIKSAYEYYLSLGYKIFNNDNLILNFGYKNRTVEHDDNKLEYTGPTIGISTTF